MSTDVEIDSQLERWLANDISPEVLRTPLPDALAVVVVDRLKQEADRYWYIDPHRSLEFAERIIAAGNVRKDTHQIALGMMARGDALKFLGRIEEAWEALEQAGKMFQAAGDEVGWARTRIGRLYLGPKLDRVIVTLGDVKRAREIFTQYGEREKLLRLDFQTAAVHNYLGNQSQALQLFINALELAESLGETGHQYKGPLYMNIGFAYDALGDFDQALAYYESAREYMLAENEEKEIAILDSNIAYIAQAQGHYRRALNLLHQILERVAGKFPVEEMWAKYDMVECYLYLNRYEEARNLAKQVINEYRANNDAYELARTLLHLTIAEAELNNFSAAKVALDEAEPIFASLGATPWVMTTHLWRGRIALKQGNATVAYQEAFAAAACFESNRQQLNYATATLLQGQAQFALGDVGAAVSSASHALLIAQQDSLPSLRYSAHLLLGQIAEAQSKDIRAMRHYQAAAATVERVQRGLTITLRPGFLEDKGEALRSLIALYFRDGQTGKAFETLERAKSQIWLSYLANREDLHWALDDARSRSLIDELTRLRDEHHWYFRLAHDPPRSSDHQSAVSQEQARTEVAIRERKMRSITEQIYLRSSHDQQPTRAPITSVNDIQRALTKNTLLIEFYNDGVKLWAFLLSEHTIEVCHLPLTVDRLNQLLAQLQSNVTAALKMNPKTAGAYSLTQLTKRILQRLYESLIEPLEIQSRRWQRLTIVPYGALHYLPFHLLYNGSSYLVEQHEIVILPAAGLVTRPNLRRRPGALILAHSREGRLPHTLIEAQMVKKQFDGLLYADEMALRTTLRVMPTQILHIAAHGQHRLDQPDLSYIQLADGQLYTDDLLQQDLSYELVTLSGCETGRVNVAPADELIGLGRGFLYAGAGALIVSLWPVVDDTTKQFMQRMYRSLRAGGSKAAALRDAQRAILDENRELHPAFWGAFQLIGDASPLSNWSG